MASSSTSRLPSTQPSKPDSDSAAAAASAFSPPDESVPSPARRRLRALLAEQRRRSQQQREEADALIASPQSSAVDSNAHAKKRTASQAGLMNAVDEREEVLSATALAATKSGALGLRTPLNRATYGRSPAAAAAAAAPSPSSSSSTASTTELTSLRNLLRERDDRLAELSVELEESKEQWRSAGEKWRRAVEAEKRERQRREEVESSLATSESAFQAERHRLTSELSNLRTASATLAADRAALESSAQAESAALKLELEQVRRQRDDLLGYRDQAHRLFESEVGLRRQLEDARARQSRDVASGGADETSLRPELRRQAQALAALEKQNSTLRDEVAELRRRRDDAELARGEAKEIDRKWREKYRILQEECDQARREVDSLTTVFPRAEDVTTTSNEEVVALRHKLSALNAAHAPCGRALAAQKAATVELARKLETVSNEAQSELARLAHSKEELERERRWEQEARQAAEKRLSMAFKELDGLRALSVGHESSSSSAPTSELVSQLESQIEVYRRTLDELGADTRDTRAATIQELDLVKRSELEEALQARQALSEQLAEARRAHEEMEIELVDLHRRVGSGEYNTEVWRVVELRDNPAARDRAIRKQALDELRAENQALLDQIVELEANSSVQGGVPRETYDRVVRDAATQEAAHAKRLQRLKEIFGSKSKEFLESVYSLLGWRIKFDENGTDVRLQSMYAPKGKMGLTIKFSSTEGHFGTMQMTGAMAKSLGDARRYWIEERQSVPGFLAQVTLEVFEKTTIGRLAGYVANEEAE